MMQATAHRPSGGPTTPRAPLYAAMATGTALPATALPSGQTVTLQEVILDDIGGSPVVRFRFLAPDIARNGGTVGFDQAALDMATLCETIAIPYIAQNAIAADHVVISLSDRAIEFGSTDPEATQYFDAFHLQDDSCIWEGF
jgi:hypothetical protein